MNKRSLGTKGEEEGRNYLISKGYEVLETNYRTKLGEIDIIALDGNTIVFVEIKTRTSEKYGRPGEAVNWKKQNVYAKVAIQYLRARSWLDKQMRFDVLEIRMQEKKTDICHIQNAFQARGGMYYY